MRVADLNWMQVLVEGSAGAQLLDGSEGPSL
jgi:hypothetical protein